VLVVRLIRTVIAMGGNELEVLEHYNRKIQKYGDRDDAAEILTKCLTKLDQVRVNISLLQDTGIGRTVSALKKRFGDHEIGTMSRDLVNKWKEVVSKEENLDEPNSEENDDDDGDDNETDAQRSNTEPPAYIPTPIAPSYTPTPIDELPTIAVTETSNNYEVHENSNKHEKASRNHKEVREKSSEERDHHKSKKKKSHQDKRSEEREESKSTESIKSEMDPKEKRKEKSHKHKHGDRERDSKHEKEKSSKDRSRDHKSSKSSHKDKSRDSESERKSDTKHVEKDRYSKHSDKDSHRAKEKESKLKIKEEKIDDYEKVKSSSGGGSSSSSGSRSREQESDADIKQKIKKEPLENGFDFMKENDSHEKKKSKDSKSKSKDKSREDGKERKSKSRELANVDIFAKSMDDSEELSQKKRHRDEEREDYSKSKKSRSDSSHKFVLPAPPTSLPPLPTGPSLIPEISPVYKPLPRLPLQNMDKVLDDRNTDEESLSILLSNKNRNRAAIYSGTKRKGFFGEVPSLFDQCIQVLKDHVDEIDEVGNLGYDILKPVLDRASPKTLMHIEDCNPYLMEETYQLWEKYVKKDFRNKAREDMESWREMYERCTVEREEKLEALKGKVKQCYKAEEDNHKKTKLAYVDSAPKAPRSIRNAQVKNGTALPVGHSMVAGAPRPRNQLGDPTANASRAGVGLKKPRVAPMMAKTMKLMKGIKGGFRR